MQVIDIQTFSNQVSHQKKFILLFHKAGSGSLTYSLSRLGPSTPDALCTKPKGVFQIQLPICRVNFSNNVSIPQVMVSMWETEHGKGFGTS